jgi:hypothetical protein
VRGGEGEWQESEAGSVCRRERKRRQGSLLPTASGASMRFLPALLDRLPRAGLLPRYEYFILPLLLLILLLCLLRAPLLLVLVLFANVLLFLLALLFSRIIAGLIAL